MKKQLSRRDVEELETSITFPFIIEKKDHVELIEDEHGRRWTLNNQQALVQTEAGIVPHIRYLLTHPLLKHVVVDMGAVKFVASGADVMRPGIKEFAAGTLKDEFVVIVDVNNKKPIAVGKMLFSGEEAEKMVTGKVVKNLHWVGDVFWTQA
ncbi:MAG TPA: PUA domain-containing protein [Candidatus Binatia bacterium]|nr:PUA domain-containing protein [Candidatus Binatia bacterium]